jgi:hypothetical protein
MSSRKEALSAKLWWGASTPLMPLSFITARQMRMSREPAGRKGGTQGRLSFRKKSLK